MQNNRITLRSVVVMIIVAVVFSILIAWADRDKPPPVYESLIPPPPSNDGTWYYDFHNQQWKPIYSSPRANGGYRSYESPKESEELNEDDLQEYLEKHVDGYLEDTYWGEEYDINDIED